MAADLPGEPPSGTWPQAFPARRWTVSRRPMAPPLQGEPSPPRRAFRLERLSGTDPARRYVVVLEWVRDPASGATRLADARVVRVQPPAPRVDVRPIAAELATLVTEGRTDPRATWDGPDRVTLLPTLLLPACRVDGTQRYRRRRLRKCLAGLLAPAGWNWLEGWTWERQRDPGSCSSS